MTMQGILFLVGFVGLAALIGALISVFVYLSRKRLFGIRALAADEPVIIDVSKWQGNINWEIAKLKIVAAYMRATMGTSSVDTQFARNSAECARLKIPWGAYHLWYAQYDQDAQAENFVNEIGVRQADGTYKLRSQLVPVIDVELHPDGYTAQMMFDALNHFVIRFHELTGVWVMIYTRKTFWDAYFPKITGLPGKCHMWVAYYSLTAAQPWVPVEWAGKWKMWQYSAGRNGRGREFGAQSSDIDINRYFGGLEGLKADYPDIWGNPDPDPEPQPEPDGGDEMATLLEKVKAIRDAYPDALININVNLVEGTVEPQPEPEPRPEPEPKPDPEPAGIVFRITVEKTNLRSVLKYNGAGAPVMQIYPSDTAPVSDRIQLFEDDTCKIVLPAVTADGGAKYFKVVDRKGRNGEALYVVKADGTQVV